MQIKVNDRRNTHFLVEVCGTIATPLYDTGANMSCMSFTWYPKLKKGNQVISS